MNNNKRFADREKEKAIKRKIQKHTKHNKTKKKYRRREHKLRWELNNRPP